MNSENVRRILGDASNVYRVKLLSLKRSLLYQTLDQVSFDLYRRVDNMLTGPDQVGTHIQDVSMITFFRNNP